MQAKKDDLLIVPIGGLEQIGANCTMIGNNKEWIIVDLGIAFYDKLGIEVLTPDDSFIVEQKDNIKGIFITHAHEDHIGAIQYLWPRIKCPVYLTEFPAAVLKQKIQEYSWKDEIKINTIKQRTPVKAGGFEVEFVSLSHSILGACGLYIKTQAGTVFHTGDWKIDDSPLLGDMVDEERLIEIGKEGVDCLLCDSTNMLTESHIGSESDVREALVKLVSKYKDKRITVTCFSSNVARLETIFSVAKKAKRKVAIVGRSMHKMLDAVSETAYFNSKFKANVNAILTDEEAASMPPEKVLIICTGSQGESRSGLFRIARGENKLLKMGKNDVVLFSSKVIPGNELAIREVQNLLVKKGVEIVTTDEERNLHVSGHPNKDIVLKMYKWLNPRSLMPVHGDPRMLFAQQDFARKSGISEVYVAESGDFVNFSGGKLSKVAHRDFCLNAIDGADLIPLSDLAIRERNIMTYNGHISISFVLSSSDKKIIGSPKIDINGIHIDSENRDKVNSIIYQILSSEIVKNPNNTEALKKEIESSVKRLMIRNFEKKPIIIVQVHKYA